MSKVIDFDAFRSEQKDEPHILKLGGKEYKLPPSIPAALALDIARLEHAKGDDGEFSEADVERMGAAMFGGSERFREILADGAVTVDEMPELIKQVLLSYGAPSPNRAARRAAGATSGSRSSKSGAGSKRTS